MLLNVWFSEQCICGGHGPGGNKGVTHSHIYKKEEHFDQRQYPTYNP